MKKITEYENVVRTIFSPLYIVTKEALGNSWSVNHFEIYHNASATLLLKNVAEKDAELRTMY